MPLKTTLRFRGGGTKDFYSQSLEGEVFDTRAYAGILSYEPSELVVTVQAGTPLAELEAALAERLAYAEAHPDPACDGKDRCVYLDPLDPGARSRV